MSEAANLVFQWIFVLKASFPLWVSLTKGSIKSSYINQEYYFTNLENLWTTLICPGKKGFLKSQWNPWKILVGEFILIAYYNYIPYLQYITKYVDIIVYSKIFIIVFIFLSAWLLNTFLTLFFYCNNTRSYYQS